MSDGETKRRRAGRRQLDEETIDLVRNRIGIPERHRQRSHNEVASSDSFRHFAEAYGDDNPLYCDPEHARSSAWRTPIAPPLYPTSAGRFRPVTWSDAEKADMSGGDPLAGIGQYMCGERWLFLRPVRAGDELWRTQCLDAADLKTSAFGGGTGALVSHRVSWENEHEEPYALRFLDFWHAERERSRKTGKYRDIERTVYTDHDLERIDACYETEEVRGAHPRSITKVAPGDQLGPIVKGPLSVTDIIAYHVGTGMGIYGVGAAKIGFKNRRRIPKFYQKNDVGFWDAAQRCHWEDAWARRLGHPAPYDYGVMRTNWMVHLVTNWMGDDAWIWKLSSSIRRFDYIGDTHYISGVVRDVDGGRQAVTIDLSGINQRGETTCDGRAVVMLPSDGSGPVDLPDYRLEDVPEMSAP